MALGFQLLNATCIGSYLAAYGPVTESAWASQSPLPQFVGGIAIFYVGLAANYFHDEELREIRRRESRRQERLKQQSKGTGNGDTTIERHYRIPQAGLFKYMLFPHYFCEWVEWFGFWTAAGFSCVPARAFLINEIFTMLPRAVNGRKWYVEKFGEEKIGKKWAIIPGVW
jgi:3-oxo-5-alpha-steroid 4-dehydrogenase 1